MKKLKNILSIILVAIIILTATSTMAYSGTLDARDDISISNTITNGKGSIDIARGVAGYKLYYQANELSNDTYKQIKQLKDELRVIQAFNIYEATQADSDYDEYASTQMYYKNLYGKNVDDCSEQKVNEDMSIIISLLPEYTDSWKQTKDNSFDIDLSSFAGTKDFVVWVKLEKQDGTKTYDAEIFELTGTKQETTNNNGSNNNGNSGTNNSGSNNNGNSGINNNGTSTDGKNNSKDTSTKSSSSTGDKTTSSSKLPYAGMEKGTTIVAILVAVAGTVVSYIKYRKLN